jgi:predicted MPP superfamily phosphohydrolase
MRRRHFLYAAGLAGFGYMRLFEPKWLSVGRHRVRLGTEPANPLTLLQLSDFHVSDVVPLSYIDRAITRALASCRPDLICLTGDFITTKWNDWDRYARILARLSRIAPTYAIMGNHDGGAWAVACDGYADDSAVGAVLARSGVRLLKNSHVVFEKGERQINLVGLGDIWAEDLNADEAYRDLNGKLPTIVLSHNPDTKDVVDGFRWNLMLSGHTHGGQLYLPGVGTPFAPVMDKRYVEGLKPWQDRWIHVTRGLGNVHGMRFNCRPEISVLEVS